MPRLGEGAEELAVAPKKVLVTYRRWLHKQGGTRCIFCRRHRLFERLALRILCINGIMLSVHTAFSDRASALLTVQTLMPDLASLQSRIEKLEAVSSKVFGG